MPQTNCTYLRVHSWIEQRFPPPWRLQKPFDLDDFSQFGKWHGFVRYPRFSRGIFFWLCLFLLEATIPGFLILKVLVVFFPHLVFLFVLFKHCWSLFVVLSSSCCYIIDELRLYADSIHTSFRKGSVAFADALCFARRNIETLVGNLRSSTGITSDG